MDTEPPSDPSTRPSRRVAPLLPALIPLALIIGTGWWGIDFGEHWDEWVHIGNLRHALLTAGVLPRYYYYPSATHDLVLAAAAPEALGAALAGRPLADAVPSILGHAFLLRARTTALTVGALAVLWVYLLVWRWRRSWGEALLAAAVLGTSWECAYHLRFLAPDGLGMQFGALTLLLALEVLRRPGHKGWLVAAGVAAGLGCATKYPLGLLLLPVLVAALPAGPDRLQTGAPAPWTRAVSAALGRTALIIGAFIAAYLLATPGTLVDSQRWLDGLKFNVQVYGQEGCYGNTVTPGADHLGRLLTYLGLVQLSPFAPLAALLAGLSLVGAWALGREAPRATLVVLVFPVLYVLYFSMQTVMVVRNLLVVAPFLAVLAARGVGFLWSRRGGRILRPLLAVGVGGALAANASFLIWAADTIARRSPERWAAEARAYIVNRPGQKFYLAPRVAQIVQPPGTAAGANVTTDPAGGADWALVYAGEAFDRWHWPSNQRRLTRRWFGPYEVNFSYYAGWAGDDRIVLMPMDQACRWNIEPLRAPAADPRGAGER